MTLEDIEKKAKKMTSFITFIACILGVILVLWALESCRAKDIEIVRLKQIETLIEEDFLVIKNMEDVRIEVTVLGDNCKLICSLDNEFNIVESKIEKNGHILAILSLIVAAIWFINAGITELAIYMMKNKLKQQEEKEHKDESEKQSKK